MLKATREARSGCFAILRSPANGTAAAGAMNGAVDTGREPLWGLNTASEIYQPVRHRHIPVEEHQDSTSQSSGEQRVSDRYRATQGVGADTGAADLACTQDSRTFGSNDIGREPLWGLETASETNQPSWQRHIPVAGYPGSCCGVRAARDSCRATPGAVTRGAAAVAAAEDLEMDSAVDTGREPLWGLNTASEIYQPVRHRHIPVEEHQDSTSQSSDELPVSDRCRATQGDGEAHERVEVGDVARVRFSVTGVVASS